MKYLIFFTLVALTVAYPSDDEIDIQFTPADMEVALSNDKLLCSYGDCLGGNGPCTPQGKDIKKFMPTAIADSCGKCSDEQKKMAATIMKGMQERCPEQWGRLQNIHDPDGTNKDKFEEFIKKYSN